MSKAVIDKPSAPEGKRNQGARPSAVSLWNYFRVRWTFLTRVCGSTPADPEMILAWLESQRPKVKPAGAKSIQEINEEVLASLESGAADELPQYSLLRFQRHNGAIAMRSSTIRAHIKDCARVLSAQYIGRIERERAFSTRVVNGVYPDPKTYWVPILQFDGSPVTESGGFFDKAVHVKGPRGEPLNALKRIEYVEPPTVMEFTLMVLGESVVEDDLHMLMEYGGTHGYAGERSDGEGRYEFEIERIAPPRRGAAIADGAGDR